MFTIKSFQFSPIVENTYLLYNEFNDCVIIDPGCYYDAEKVVLVSFIEDKKLKPTMLLNTHCHLDHVFGNKFIAEKYNLTLQMHKNEEPVLAFAVTSGLMYNLPFDNYEGDFIFLNDGDTIQLGKDELKVLLTSGHSPGSISFYCAKQNFVIAGDVLFKNSVGRSDLPGGNHEQLIKGIKEKLLTLPNNTIVYNGHGEATMVGIERVENAYLQ